MHYTISRRGALKGAAVAGFGAALGGLAVGQTAAVAAPAIISCGEWGARPPSRALTRLNRRPERIIIHHTAGGNSNDLSRAHAIAVARSIQNHHMDTNGWEDSGQHFTVTRGGYVLEGRRGSLETLNAGNAFMFGTHCPNQNDRSIGIENEGTYISERPPALLYNTLVQLCAHICRQYGISPQAIDGHKDYFATACPGATFHAMLPQLRADVAAALSPRVRRLGALSPQAAGQALIVKEGALDAGWGDTQSTGVVDFQFARDRIGVLTTAGDVLVKEGALNALWTHQIGNATAFQLRGNRIGVLQSSGELWVKEGGLYADWFGVQAGSVQSFALSGNRIAYVGNDGVLWAKEGTTQASWVGPQLYGVQSVQLEGERIGCLTTDGSVYVKEGNLYADWTVQIGNATAFQLHGNRIGVLQSSGELWVKEGGLHADWFGAQAGSVGSFALSGNRIAYVGNDGVLWAKEGSTQAAWVGPQMHGVQSLQLDGDRLGCLTTDGNVHVKEGSLYAHWVGPQTGSPMGAFKLHTA